MRLQRRDLMLGISVLLAGCGFHPLYAPRDAQDKNVMNDLKLVRVDNGYERIGQLLRLAAQERLEGSGAPVEKHYDLTLLPSFAEDAMGFEQNSSTTRLRFTSAVNYILRRRDEKKSVMTTGTVKLIDAINQFDNQPFNADLEIETVEKRMMQNLADLVVERLAVYFRQHPGGVGDDASIVRQIAKQKKLDDQTEKDRKALEDKPDDAGNLPPKLVP